MKIPKVAHFYWGNESLPYLRYLTLYSFRKFNPDWKIILYTPTDLQKGLSWRTSEHKRPIGEVKNYFSLLKNLKINIVKLDMKSLKLSNEMSEVHKSDFLRWHLLGTVGGLWSDMDILFFKPMKKMNILNSNTVICFSGRIWRVGFLASSPGNQFFKNTFNVARKKLNSSSYQSIGSTLMRTTYWDPVGAGRKYPQYSIYNMSMSVVYPAMISLIYGGCDKSLIKWNTIGLHWYAGHPSARRFIELIDDKSYKKYGNKNLLTWAVKKVVEG